MMHSSARQSACVLGGEHTMPSSALRSEKDLSPNCTALNPTSVSTLAEGPEPDDNETDNSAARKDAEETEIVVDSESSEETGSFDLIEEASPVAAEAATPKMAHDSMVTVRLSEPPSLTLDASTVTSPTRLTKSATFTVEEEELEASENEDTSHASLPSDLTAYAVPSPSIQLGRSLEDELGQSDPDATDADSSEDNEEVDWEQLEKTEDEQTKGDDADNTTALLLARLEQENAKLVTNPKSFKTQAAEKLSSQKTRPPSMAQLRKMVNGPTPSALRYSMLPPPPMTDLEFFAALVKDYQQTAARLPTLLSNKIRKGIPPPLRGAVWQSMSGARDAVLAEQYDRFCGESSPYELLIGKDLGRSFPGVDMFREPEGDGQQMLGRVLKSFSLYDAKIGYCQGLAFLVGPLLMHMPDKAAFCVLVRLMERYDLRDCFLPDLSGLHTRIFQFRELLSANLPALSNHLEDLQVETAYVSQWFLSFFAVTCPLPMLFRIYDVIFAEGASETLMRVALSLMRKNEARLMACLELEDAMQLLLSRGLWDCYHYDADEFVQDFAGLSGIVTKEKLSQLEQAYRESLIATANVPRASDTTTAASRFLGRIWTSSTKSTNLTASQGVAPARPLSMLRRSPSKQSIASTLNSIEASSASVTSSISTDATTLSRESASTDDASLSRESTPVGSKSTAIINTTEERYLHSQIEDLLTALSELQRDHALLSNQLQSERDEREEDRQAVQSLLEGLRRKAADPVPSGNIACAETAARTETDSNENTPSVESIRRTSNIVVEQGGSDSPSTEDLSELLNCVETRFAFVERRHRSSMAQSKSQLRDELLSTKEQLALVVSRSQENDRQTRDMEQELSTLKEQLRERHSHVRSLHQDKQKLEKQLQGMRARVSSSSITSEACHCDGDPDAAGKGKHGGLRELKLSRSKSTPSQTSDFNKRMSSLTPSHTSTPTSPSGIETPPNEHESLLLELVQAKTAEATAKQEAEEAKQKLEALRRAHGVSLPDTRGSLTAPNAMGALAVFSRLAGQTTNTPVESSTKLAATTAGIGPPNTGGFWGWRR